MCLYTQMHMNDNECEGRERKKEKEKKKKEKKLTTTSDISSFGRLKFHVTVKTLVIECEREFSVVKVLITRVTVSDVERRRRRRRRKEKSARNTRCTSTFVSI